MEAKKRSEFEKMSITCDQVAWLKDIADRYIPRDDYPTISRQREMKKYAMLYEIMEVVGLVFEDGGAINNGTPQEVRT
jgi:hypothetical protein